MTCDHRKDSQGHCIFDCDPPKIKITSVDLEEFKLSLELFCQNAGYEIAGTCSSEGIYGEITIKKIGEYNTWTDWNKNKFNFED